MDAPSWLPDYVLGVLRSPTWVLPLAQFKDEHCQLFDDVEDEFRLEHTVCHNEFKNLVLILFETHLAEVCVSSDDLERFCDRGFERHEQLHRALVEELLAVDDFLTFKALMVKHSANLRAQAIALDPCCNTCSLEQDLPDDEAAADSVVARSVQAGMAEGTDDWYQFEEEMQLRLALEASERDSEGLLDAEQRCEEAALQHAIALSLQLEEERLRQGQTGTAEVQLAAAALPPTAGFTSAPLVQARARGPREVVPQYVCVAPLEAKPWGFTSAPLMQVHGVRPAAAAGDQHPGALPALPPPGALPPAEVKAALPPLVGAASALEGEAARLALDGLRRRAEQALSCTAARAPERAAALPPVQAAGGPTAEELQQRAEHLRQQRDRLLQARARDRMGQLEQFQQLKAAQANAAGIDTARRADALAQGRRLVAELTPAAVVAADHGETLQGSVVPGSADRMRQVLTLQLRNSLMQPAAGSAEDLSAQLQQLESLKGGA